LNAEQKPALKPWQSRRISKEDYEEYVAQKKARQINAPEVGQPAPDFEIEHLDAHGRPTGKPLRLSSVHGKPVALVFGSYT